MTLAAKRHMTRVAEYASEHGCACCGQPYAHVHHVMEGRTPGRRSDDWLTIGLCEPCHTGTHGIHGTRQRWSLNKMSEMQALAETYAGIYGRT